MGERKKDKWKRADQERLRRSVAEAQRLSRELHDGVIGPSAAEYATWVEDVQANKAMGLMNMFGNWTAFLEHCGLRKASRAYYIRAGRAHREQLQAQLDEEFARLEELRRKQRLADEFQGLPIGRVRRELVYDTSRHCYRWMVLMEVR